MGIFADIRGMAALQKIKSGGIAKLSISQITGMIVNMPDARKKLSTEEFSAVYKLYKSLRTCNTKIEMDMPEYIRTAVDIIKRFDEYAPYEKYSGGNELEFSFLMDDIRAESQEVHPVKNYLVRKKNI